MNHLATYAHRFNRRAITRPKPTLAEIRVAMTDEEFVEHLATLPSDLARNLASIQRNFERMSKSWPVAR